MFLGSDQPKSKYFWGILCFYVVLCNQPSLNKLSSGLMSISTNVQPFLSVNAQVLRPSSPQNFTARRKRYQFVNQQWTNWSFKVWAMKQRSWDYSAKQAVSYCWQLFYMLSYKLLCLRDDIRLYDVGCLQGRRLRHTMTSSFGQINTCCVFTDMFYCVLKIIFLI